MSQLNGALLNFCWGIWWYICQCQLFIISDWCNSTEWLSFAFMHYCDQLRASICLFYHGNIWKIRKSTSRALFNYAEVISSGAVFAHKVPAKNLIEISFCIDSECISRWIYLDTLLEKEFYLTRTITLNAVTLGCLIWFWFNEVDCSRHNDNNRDWIDSEMECRPVSKIKRCHIVHLFIRTQRIRY